MTRVTVCAAAGAMTLALVGVIATPPVEAHHAFSAEFDARQPVHFEGTVVRVEWINPHAWIHIDVTMEDGSVERWMIEGGNPHNLFRRGVRRDVLQAGDGDRRRRLPREGTGRGGPMAGT